MPWGIVAAGAINYLGSQNGNAPAQAADPFASQRLQYQQQLKQMMTGTFSPSDPSYEWRAQQGEAGVNRGMAVSGQLGSGNQMAQLQLQGQNMASQEYNNQFTRLSSLAGMNIGSPGTAGQIMQQNQQQQYQGLGVLGYSLGKQIPSLFNNGTDMTGFQNGTTQSATNGAFSDTNMNGFFSPSTF